MLSKKRHIKLYSFYFYHARLNKQPLNAVGYISRFTITTLLKILLRCDSFAIASFRFLLRFLRSYALLRLGVRTRLWSSSAWLWRTFPFALRRSFLTTSQRRFITFRLKWTGNCQLHLVKRTLNSPIRAAPCFGQSLLALAAKRDLCS